MTIVTRISRSASGYTSASATPSGEATPLAAVLAEHEVPERRADARHDHPRVEQELPPVGGARAHREGEERGERERIARDEEQHRRARARGPRRAGEQGPRARRRGRRSRPPPRRPAGAARAPCAARARRSPQARQNSATSTTSSAMNSAAATRLRRSAPRAGEAQPEQIAQRHGDGGRRDDESGGWACAGRARGGRGVFIVRGPTAGPLSRCDRPVV